MLVDSTPIKVAAFARLFEPHGPEAMDRAQASMRGSEGISRVEKMRPLFKEVLGVDLDDVGVAAQARRYSELVEDAVVDCPWVPGAQEFLEAYAGRLPLFVVTGTPEDEILRIVERRGMGRYFDAVRGSPPRKPPIVRELLEANGLAPERSAFIGDAIFDYETAVETGLAFIGRVPAGEDDPFPSGTETMADLTGLAERLGRAA